MTRARDSSHVRLPAVRPFEGRGAFSGGVLGVRGRGIELYSVRLLGLPVGLMHCGCEAG
jgi:hypothetical protein